MEHPQDYVPDPELMYSQRHIEDLTVLCLQRLNYIHSLLMDGSSATPSPSPLPVSYIHLETIKMKYMPSPFCLTPPTTSPTSSSALTPTIMAVNGQHLRK